MRTKIVSAMMVVATSGLLAAGAGCAPRAEQPAPAGAPGKGDSYCHGEQCVANCGQLVLEGRGLAHRATAEDALDFELQGWIQTRGAPSQFCDVAAAQAQPGHRLGGAAFKNLRGRLPVGWQLEVADWVRADAVLSFGSGWLPNPWRVSDGAVAAEVRGAEAVLWRVFTLEGLEQLRGAARMMARARVAFIDAAQGWLEVGFRPLTSTIEDGRLVVAELADDPRCGGVQNHACADVKWAKVDDGQHVRSGALVADGELSLWLDALLCGSSDGAACASRGPFAAHLLRPDFAPPAQQAFAMYLKLGTDPNASQSLKLVVDSVGFDLALEHERWVAVAGDGAAKTDAVRVVTNLAYREQQQLLGAASTIGQLFVRPAAPLHRCGEEQMFVCRDVDGETTWSWEPCAAGQTETYRFNNNRCHAFHVLHGPLQEVEGLSGYQVGLFGNSSTASCAAPAVFTVWGDAPVDGTYFRVNPDQPYYVLADDVLAAQTPAER